MFRSVPGFYKTCLTVLCGVSFFGLCDAIHYPDFDESMVRKGLSLESYSDDFHEKNEKIYEERNQTLKDFFSDLYYKNILRASEDQDKLRIPKIIHQIWLGSPVPKVFEKWMNSWASLQGWQYMLWTDENVKDLRMHNQHIYNQSTNYGEKSDILRLEILSKFGGVYVDVDFECLKPEVFEELHHSYDFYIGFEPLEHGFVQKFNMFKVCNAIVASAPSHPLIQDLIINLRANYYAYFKNCSVIQRTGPSFLTRMICEHELAGLHTKRNMYLPCTFFYPTSEQETRYFLEHPDIPCRLRKETAGFHYWFGSWWREKGTEGSIYMVETE